MFGLTRSIRIQWTTLGVVGHFSLGDETDAHQTTALVSPRANPVVTAVIAAQQMKCLLISKQLPNAIEYPVLATVQHRTPCGRDSHQVSIAIETTVGSWSNGYWSSSGLYYSPGRNPKPRGLVVPTGREQETPAVCRPISILVLPGRGHVLLGTIT